MTALGASVAGAAVGIEGQAAAGGEGKLRAGVEGIAGAAVGFAVGIGGNRVPALREPGDAGGGIAPPR